jgi:D-alanyl-D-alanine dipeptidase
MKPYLQVPIHECGEPLAVIPADILSLAQPHPYIKLGAPYGSVSPYYLRQSVLDALLQANALLQKQRSDWKIFVFDAYRPVPVQQFMVDYTFTELLQVRGLQDDDLDETQRQALMLEVYQIWALPSLNPLTPPPHSTGAAVDITLVDSMGKLVWMGSEIDELSPRSQPNYFQEQAANPEVCPTEREQAVLADTHRQLLSQVMEGVGFERHPGEWWHFSLGDQLWAWQRQQRGVGETVARFGRAELIH